MKKLSLLLTLSAVLSAQDIIVVKHKVSGGGATKIFTHSQATATAENTSSTTCQAILGVDPSPGHVVVASVMIFNGTATAPVSATVADSNGHSYTKSTNSPGTTDAIETGFPYIFHLDNAPGGGTPATKTVTATFSTSTSCTILLDDFAVTNGPAVYDQDIVGSGVVSPTNSPTIAVSGTGELAICVNAVLSSTTSVNTPWVTGAISSPSGVATGYILSLSSSQVWLSSNSGGAYLAVCADFK